MGIRGQLLIGETRATGVATAVGRPQGLVLGYARHPPHHLQQAVAKLFGEPDLTRARRQVGRFDPAALQRA